MKHSLLGFTLLFALADAGAATILVTRFDDPPMNDCATDGCSLREAAMEAGLLPGSDTISLPAGDYVLESQGAVSEVTLALPEDTTLQGVNAKTTSIRANGPGSMFLVGGGKVVFRRVTIRDADADGSNYYSTFGGAIRAYAADVTLDRVILRDNHASQGGAIYLDTSTLQVNYSSLYNNDSGFGGGAIQLHNTPTTIYRSIIENNAGSGGGGIRAQGSPVTVLAGSQINDNRAQYGGGAVAGDNVFSFDDTCEVDGNIAPLGGAFASFGGTLTVRGVATVGGTGLLRISGNRAESPPYGAYGGAVSAGSPMILERVELIDNEATYGGGAIYATQTRLTVRDSRIANNIAGSVGGGAMVFDSAAVFERVAFDGNVSQGSAGAISLSGSKKISLHNVDIYDNVATSAAAISNGVPLSLKHVTIWNNLSGSARDAVHQFNTGSTFYSNSLMLGRCTGTTASISSAGNNLRTSEIFNACAGTTTSTSALALSRGNFGGLFPISGTTASVSPLVNAGATLYCLDKDVRNATRVAPCDIGAFEYGVTP